MNDIDTTDILARAMACSLSIGYLIRRMGDTGDASGLVSVLNACLQREEEAKLIVRDQKTFTEAE